MNYETKLVDMNNIIGAYYTIDVTATAWEDENKRFLCGVLSLFKNDVIEENSHQDYNDFIEISYGKTIEEAVDKFYDKVDLSKYL